jgi:hypothetical protein
LTKEELEDREERLRARPRVPEPEGSVAQAIEDFADDAPRRRRHFKEPLIERWRWIR